MDFIESESDPNLGRLTNNKDDIPDKMDHHTADCIRYRLRHSDRTDRQLQAVVGCLARTLPLRDLRFDSGEASLGFTGQLVGATEAGDFLSGLFFRTWGITEDLSDENLNVDPVGISTRQRFGEFKSHAMLLLKKKAHCEMTRCLIVARGYDRSVAAIFHKGRIQRVFIAVVEVERDKDANPDIIVCLDKLLQRRRLRLFGVVLKKRKAQRLDLGLKRCVVAPEWLGKRANAGADENAGEGEQANQPFGGRHRRCQGTHEAVVVGRRLPL